MFTTGLPSGARVEPQSALLLLRAMALDASLDEQRTNLRLKKGNTVGVAGERARDNWTTQQVSE